MCKRAPGSLIVEKRLDASEFWSGKNKEGMASAVFNLLLLRNTQMPEEKFWNETKVLQYSNTKIHK